MDSYSHDLKTLFKGEIPFEIPQKRIDLFYDLLIETNKKVNLTRIIDRQDFDHRHILDSWALLKILPCDKNPRTIFDIGTGGGIPGIPLWLVYPQWNWVMIDSVNKKLKAIDEMCLQLRDSEPKSLSNLPKTCHGRAEDLGHDTVYREKADIVVSRALAPLSTLLEYCAPFVKVGGSFIAMKGPAYKDELNQKTPSLLGLQLKDTLPYQINEREFYLLHYTKLKKTPPKYPRDAGIPKKKPLG